MNIDTVFTEAQRELAQTAADRLHLPRYRCRLRQCRRSRFCGRHILATRMPVCIHNLLAGENAFMADFLTLLFRIHAGSHPPSPSPDPARRDVEEFAIEVIHSCPMALAGREAWFKDWIARYLAPPAPPIDAGALLAEMKATLACDRMMSELRG